MLQTDIITFRSHNNYKQMNINSLCVKPIEPNTSTKPHQLPLFLSSSFEMESTDSAIDIFTKKKKGHVYSRYGNPTIDAVAQRIADMEVFGSELTGYGFLTSSGMSAISTLLMSMLNSGDAILTQSNLYGGSTELLNKVLSRMGIESIFVNLEESDKIEQLLQERSDIKMIYFETPANPTLACIDIEKICTIAQKYNILTAIDNTFCTPYLQRPLVLGTDFVIHSTTKYLNGHGNSIAGAIVCSQAEHAAQIWETLKLTGSTCNPFDAWLLANGIRTLPLRMDRHSSNALALAQYLADHDRVSSVNYCGLANHESHEIASKQMSQYGGMMSFSIKGGIEEAKKTIDNLKIATHAPTLGDVDTLVLHPATSSHLNIPAHMRRENGIEDGMIRVSVGIEDIADLISDFDQALSSW